MRGLTRRLPLIAIAPSAVSCDPCPGAASSRHLEAVRLCHDGVHFVDDYGGTMLHYAALMNDRALARHSHPKEILLRERVAENAPQNKFAFLFCSRGFSATHLLKRNSFS